MAWEWRTHERRGKERSSTSWGRMLSPGPARCTGKTSVNGAVSRLSVNRCRATHGHRWQLLRLSSG